MSEFFFFFMNDGTAQAQVLGRLGKCSTNEVYPKHMNLYLHMEGH